MKERIIAITNSIRSAALMGMAVSLLTVTALAHSPFGSSTRAVLGSNSFEIRITMGEALAAPLLKGIPPEAHRPVEPSLPYSLPREVGAQLYEVTSDSRPLAATRVELRLDGVDFEFTLIYPRSTGQILNLRAIYLETLDAAGVAPLVLMEENGQQLNSALLSKSQNTMAVALPTVDNAPAPPPKVPAANKPPNFREFLLLGIEHILTGFDHLLFLGALLIGCRRLAPMLGVITCFTLAHSITLALAAMNVAVVSSRLVEPLIAASIICVALDNLRLRQSVPGRYWMALGFGLIHGFAFAGALQETGLGPAGCSLIYPLVSFNLGVECGQLAVLALILTVLFQLRRWPVFAQHGNAVISAAILTVSVFWLVEQTLPTAAQ